MWRVSRPKLIDIYALRDRIVIAGASCARTRNQTSCRALSSPTSRPDNGGKSSESSSSLPPPPSNGSSRTALIGSGIGVMGVVLFTGYTAYNDTCRFWVVEKIPATERFYSYFNLSTLPPLPEHEVESSRGRTSVVALADKSVLNISSEIAAAKDQNKESDEIRRKEEEKHQQKRAERDKQVADMKHKQEDAARSKLVQDMQRKQQENAEKEQAGKQVLNRVKLNKEFEARASKEVSALNDTAAEVMNLNEQTIAICKEHAAKLREALDANLDEDATKVWPRVHELNELRVQRLEQAHQRQQQVEGQIVDLIKFIDQAKKDSDTSDNESIPSYRQQVQKVAFDVKSVYDKLNSQQTVSNVMKHYYCMLQKDKAEFKKELEAIVPEVTLGDKGLNLPVEDLNALLAHSHRRIFQLRRQLVEQQLYESQRLEDALCEQKKRDMAEASEKVGDELDRQYEQLQLDKEASLMSQANKFETELRTQLAKQASEHQDRLQDQLALQEKKLGKQFDLDLSKKVIHERHVYIDQIMKHMAKVKGLEAALEERANMGEVITEVQDLVSSTMCLVHAIARDVDCPDENYRIMKLDEPLKRCAQAGEHNAFVQCILHGIPPKAIEEGIYSMSSLKKRFDKVYKESSRAAAYSTDNTFGIVSALRSMLHTRSVRYYTACEFENADGMTMQELLDQAEYFMQKNCLPQAVQCLVQLTGDARSLAQGWIEEARLVLEVRQAAQILQSYAQSKGMGTVF